LLIFAKRLLLIYHKKSATKVQKKNETAKIFMKRTQKIKSVRQLIDYKTRRLEYTRMTYLREILLKDIADLEQVEDLFWAVKKEKQQLLQDCIELDTENDRLKLMLKLHGLSDDEIFYYSIMQPEELIRLAKRAVFLGEYKIPQRLQTNKNLPMHSKKSKHGTT